MNTYLVTGALGCIGAWTVHHLIRRGARVVALDLSTHGHRLDLLLSAEEQRAITFVQGDIVNTEQVVRAVSEHAITHIIHLAALQVPFCRADPVKGAQVNVVGTVNVFEAARQMGVKHLALASSVAVYGPPDAYPPGRLSPDAAQDPRTLYGVYKQADEGIARVYWQEHQISSTVLRPYTVYGVGRDQGLTSDPTKAMLAAAAGRPYHIAFGGTTQLQWASDVAQQFIQASDQVEQGAVAYNLGGDAVTVAEIVRLIRAEVPGAAITHGDASLPFPLGLDDRDLTARAGRVFATPLADGIHATIGAFRALLVAGRVRWQV
jgi:nucleoside-diphosphate-sugar epimerase